MNTDVDWSQFVADARTDLAKDAVLGGSALPRWLLTGLLRYPVGMGIGLGAAAAALPATEGSVDWWFVALIGCVFGGASVVTGLILRSRIRGYVQANPHNGANR